MGRVWDVCGYLPDYDESDRYDGRSGRTCNPHELIIAIRHIQQANKEQNCKSNFYYFFHLI